MSDRFDLILRGGVVLGPFGRAAVDVGVRSGRIAAIGGLYRAEAETVFDARGLHVLPGVIDSQVHFREPGAEHKEDLETGATAAVLGGVTCVFEMPNTKPSTTTLGALEDKIARATGRMSCDFAFWFGATAENVDLLSRAERAPGCAGVKLFMGSSTGDLLVDRTDDVRRVLASGRRRVAVHSEDEERLESRKDRIVAGDPRSHPIWRDPEAARVNTERLIALARETGRPTHVLHISTFEELPLLAANKDLISAEATPHHLTLDGAEAYPRLGSRAQMNPPVRGAAARDAIFDAVRQGVIDVLGSDHAPHTLDEKAQPYPKSPSGMPGVQTLVPVMLNHVAAGRLSLERFVDLTAHGPQRLFNIARKGRIAVGYDADFTIVDLGARRRIENSWIASRCGWTPYDGMEVTGWPAATVVRGAVVMRDGAVVAPGRGRPAAFVDGAPVAP